MTWNAGHLLKSGQYEVIRLIGSGGFGMTYLAKDLNLARQVVIKRPNLSFEADRDYDKFLRRFKREGQVLAQVQIPNIVRVIEFTEIEGMPCLVMNFVAGETLNECIRRQQFIPENEAWQLFQKLAIAVESLHQQGIIHCDIHPGNIIVQQNGEPVLIDFGSTKLLHPTTWTVTTTVNKDFGPYEQIAESDENALGSQPTWDIYSLAASMYFAVTGQKPISAISRKLYGDSLKSPKELKPDLSAQLNHMILQGMALEAINRKSYMITGSILLDVPTQPFIQGEIPDIATESSSKKQESISSLKQKKLDNSSSLPKEKIKITFLLTAISFLTLGYFLQGVVLGNNAGALAWVLAWAFSWAFAWAWVSAGASSLTGVLAWAGTGTFAWALVWAWFSAGAFAWVGALVRVSANVTDWLDDWLVIATLCGALLGGGYAGFVTSTGIIWGLCYGLFAWGSLIAILVGYANSEYRLKKDFSKIQIFFIYGMFPSIGLISGGILGSWLKVADIIKLP